MNSKNNVNQTNGNSRRRWKYGTLSLAITALGVVLVVAANGVIGLLTDRFGWTADLTAEGRYGLSSDTEDYLAGLESDVDIYVMRSEEDLATGSYYVVQAYEALLAYQRGSDHIRLEFVDLTSNPTFAARYPELELGSWDILVESGERREVLTFSRLYDYSADGASITASRVEEKLTNAILTVVSGEKTAAVLLTGCGDASPDDLLNLMEANRFAVSECSLVTGEIDPAAELAILFAPQTDPEPERLEKLDAWLDNGGNQGRSLLVFLDPNFPDLPNLQAFLADWGIGLGEGYAFESRSSLYYERPFYPIAQYGDMDYAEGMTAGDLTVMALCRPVEALFDSRDNYETTVLLRFTESAGRLPLGAAEVSAEDVTGDVTAMVLSTHSWYGAEVTRSHVVVSGSALAFSSGLTTSATFANGRYILGIFQKLAAQGTGVSIPVKSLTTPVHSMTGAQASGFVWAFLVILPAAVLALGTAVWLRRRRK